MRTSKEMSTARASVASPESSAAAFDALPITPGRLSAKRLQREVHPPLAVSARALEPGLPGGFCGLARLLQLFFRRIHDRHAQLGQLLARQRVEGEGVGPLLLLEVRLLDGVEHDLLEILV